jgi:protein involved in polysaccharide export with SLBB domain
MKRWRSKLSLNNIVKLLLLPVVIYSTALAQLTPEQEKLKEEFLKQRQARTEPPNSDLLQLYTSHVAFDNQDSTFYTPTEGSVPAGLLKQPFDTLVIQNPADVQIRSLAKYNANDTTKDTLTIFGYNMFDGSPESYSPILEASPPPDYKLGPGDNLVVNIWGRVDMQLDLTIDREGKVFIPKAGEIAAWGVTLDEFKRLVNAKLSAIYSDYQFSVTLGKIRRIKVFVYGEVKRPGGYTTSSLATFFNALYLAGGPNCTGSLRAIKHIRNSKVLAQVDLYRFLIEGDNSQDSRLESGDVIFVPVTGPLVRISGQVKRPAIYELSTGEKVTDIIKLAGGTTAEAFLEMVSIDRVAKDDSRIIKDVDLSEKSKASTPELYEKANFALADGDRIRIPSVFDIRKNTIKLMGNVKHPGTFGLTDSMRVSVLIDNGEQFRRDTYLQRANLFRTFPDQTRQVYAVNLEQILAGIDSTNYLLMDNDSLVIYSQNEIKRDMTVTIHGAVKRPGVYEYFENMRLSDLIFLSGNPLKQTYLLQAEVARVNPGKPADIFYANLENVFSEYDSPENIPLKEDDNIFIRNIPRWRVDNNVTIDGEVMFPGSYELMKDNERLLDLIARSGGFTPDAFKQGIVFIRNSIAADVEKRQTRTILASTEMTVLDSLNRPLPKLDQTLDIKNTNRIIINPDELFRNPNSPDNIVLQQGDYVYIPRRPGGVQVLGAVASNGTVVYKEGEKLDYFVKASGGYNKNADKGQARLAKANGIVLAGHMAYKSSIEPGDIIIVPQKLQRIKPWLQSTSAITAMVSSLLTLYVLVYKVRN